MKPLSQHSEASLDEIANLLKALADRTRLQIMQILYEGEISVGDIVKKLNFTQANISKHLRVLHQAGLVNYRKEGTVARYFIADACVKKICSAVCEGHSRLFEKKVRSLTRSIL